MAINNPAQPSTAGLGTTQDESRGGLFTDTNGVGIDLSGVRGPDGVGVASISAVRDGATGLVTITYTLSNGSELTASYTVMDGMDGTNGINGQPGSQGDRGETGAAGANVESAAVDSNGRIAFRLSDGSTVVTTGDSIIGERGPAGPVDTVQSTHVNADGTLTITFDSGDVTTATSVIGPMGPEGPRIQSAELNEAGNMLTFTLSDGSQPVANGPFQGPQGDSVTSVALVSDGGNANSYHFEITITDNVTSTTIQEQTRSFTVPQGQDGQTGERGPMGDPGERGPMGDPGVSIDSVTYTGGTTAGEITNLMIMLSNGQTISIPIQPGRMGTAGTGTSTTFRGAGGISITDDPDGTVVITDNQDAQSIQGADIVGTNPPVSTDPLLLEYNPTSGNWVYVPFPTGGAAANDATISLVPGSHLTLGSNSQAPSDQPVRFTTNQSDNEEITIDLRTIDTFEEFRQAATTQPTPADGQGTALVEAHVLRQAIEDATAPSGNAFPAIPAPTSGDEFILIGQADPTDNGFYFYDGTEWVKDNTDPNAALAVWTPGAAYQTGDQVLHNGGSDTNSIYLARNDISSTTQPQSDQDNWFLVRSGIVSIQGPGDANPEPLTSNATLHFVEGPGIDIVRTAETARFTIGMQHTGTHDVDEFTPGWAYSFYDLANNMARTGVVADELGVASFSEIFYIHGGIRLIFADGQGHFSTDTTDPTNIFAFRTYAADQPAAGDPDTRSPLFPGATQDYIVYCQRTTSPTGSAEATVIQVDPPVNTLDELGALMGVPEQTPALENRVFANNVQVPGFQLNEHHSSDVTGTYAWAHTGNLTRIPTNKLPTDIAYTQSVDVTRSADDTTPEAIAIDANGNLGPTLQPQPKVVNDLDDVNLTQPTETPVVEGLLWDATEEEWTNSAISQTLEGLTDTAIPTPGNEQYLRYSTERGNDAQGDPLPPAWVAVDLPQMASGRIEFTQDGSAYVATAFIEDPDTPNVSTPISSTSITAGNGNQLAFTLARAATLALNVPDFDTLAWDQAFGTGVNPQTSIRATGTTDPLFPTQELVDLFTNSGNVTIVPSTSDPDPGPWTISFTDPSLVQSPTTGNSLIGGVTTAIAFRATNNETGTTADANGAVVRWNNVGFTIVNDRLGTPSPFNETISSYSFTFRTTNILTNNNARYSQAESTINGGATTTVDGQTNIVGQNIGIGNAGIVPVVVTSLPIYYNDTVPTDIVGVNFRRPSEVTGTELTFPDTIQTDTQPTWTYPLWWFAQAQTEDAPTTSAPFLAGTRIQAANQSRTRPLGNLGITYENTSGADQHIYIAYPQGSPQVNTVDVQSTIMGSTGMVQNLTIMDNNRGSGINFENSAAPTPADTREVYNWFRLDITNGATLAITNVNP